MFKTAVLVGSPLASKKEPPVLYLSLSLFGSGYGTLLEPIRRVSRLVITVAVFYYLNSVF
jgi:hypothetical protein